MTAVSTHEPFGAQVALLHRISSIVSSELSLDEMLAEGQKNSQWFETLAQWS
jgi:hypothetical protein